jgi:transposase
MPPPLQDKRRGVMCADDRRVVNEIFRIFRSGGPRRIESARFGSFSTCCRIESQAPGAGQATPRQVSRRDSNN